MHDPRAEYARRLEERRAVVARARAVDGRVGSAGLWCLSALVAAAVAAWVGWIHPAWLTIPFVGFVVFWIIHARLDARARRLESGVRHYERGIARIEGRWAGAGRSGAPFEDPAHPYASDLDLFGRGSLFELLCTVQTSSGEKRLAEWLLSGGAAAEVRERQEAVGDLRDRLDLREDLGRLAGDAEARVRPEDLTAWGAAPPVFPGRGLRDAARLFTIAMIAAIVIAAAGITMFPFVFILFAVVFFSWRLRPGVSAVTELAERSERELDVLAAVLLRLERESFRSPRLQGLQADVRKAGAEIARLARLVQLLQSVRNELFKAIAGLFLWKIHCAFAIEAWRLKWGKAIPGWLSSLGDLEALGALAAYAYEHPRDPFPEIADAGPVYEGEQLGHPLLPEETCVRNDVRLGETPRVLIVSGSNMSGKSTLLRTVGTNAVLALAGAPVRARKLRVSPTAIGATIRVQDSLQAGTSRFYAEITRIKQLLEISAGPRPLLFLLEEILHGTNSHDRAIGAEAVVRELVARNAIGLVTTHDLALARTADALGGLAANVHFEDQVMDGKLAFDYILRPGVVRKSNALELMRAVGIPVQGTAQEARPE